LENFGEPEHSRLFDANNRRISNGFGYECKWKNKKSQSYV